jgi:hypothetical protein
MKLNEFKAWFEGYTEGMDGAPSKKQWERIKEQVAAIDGIPITERVYIDRYWPRTIWNSPYNTYGAGVATSYSDTLQRSVFGGSSLEVQARNSGDGGTVFDSVAAMYAAGLAEASS